MNGGYPTDTNGIIALLAKDSQIHYRIADAIEVFVPCVAIGELYSGLAIMIKYDRKTV